MNVPTGMMLAESGPGSLDDLKKAAFTLEFLMTLYYPNATGYSHAMMLVARDVQTLRKPSAP